MADPFPQRQSDTTPEAEQCRCLESRKFQKRQNGAAPTDANEPAAVEVGVEVATAVTVVAAPTDDADPAGVGIGVGMGVAVGVAAMAAAPTDDNDPAGVGVAVGAGVAATVGAAVAPGGGGKLGGGGGGEYPSTGMNVPYSTLTLAAEAASMGRNTSLTAGRGGTAVGQSTLPSTSAPPRDAPGGAAVAAPA